jgi:hypothetical protein
MRIDHILFSFPLLGHLWLHHIMGTYVCQYRLQLGTHLPRAGDPLAALLFQHTVHQIGKRLGHVGATLGQVRNYYR